MRSPACKSLLASSLALSLASCALDFNPTSRDLDNDPPLANVDELLAGAPKADDIPREHAKFDDLGAVRSDSLREDMSPVKSQGSRGVCSIFSTAGYMEHLYIAAGHDTPDFSEQYLQWSAKFEVNSFPQSSGSNAYYNLQAINRFGIVKESVWPYETTQWDTFDDPECDGEDDQPTKCYTNGHPTDAVKAAEKFHLPSSKYLNPRDIKGHIASHGTGVVAGMTFFYQSWNHRKSELPTNANYWNEGYVLAPNAKDRQVSLEKRAGHSILIFGWDDDLEVPIVDENGDTVVDSSGNVVTEKGFYIFKNSWGTSGFGIDHELGAGYGYISQAYVHEFASVRVADKPQSPVGVEICGDGIDNDGNNLTDCADPVCANNTECQSGGETLTFDGEGGLAIPDDDATGISSVIDVDTSGTITELTVNVNVTHTYRADLRVELRRGSKTVVLFDQSGGSADDLVKSFAVTDFDGSDLRGEWTLVVSDHAAQDVGVLNSWSLKVGVNR